MSAFFSGRERALHPVDRGACVLPREAEMVFLSWSFPFWVPLAGFLEKRKPDRNAPCGCDFRYVCQTARPGIARLNQKGVFFYPAVTVLSDRAQWHLLLGKERLRARVLTTVSRLAQFFVC